MTNPKLLLPLRVPELGPSLGKLVSGAGRNEGALLLDPIRYRLGTRIIECAGEARRLAASDERSAALAAVSRANWEHAWEEAINAVAAQVVQRVTEHLGAEADAVGMGRRKRARLEYQQQEKVTLRARLACAGADLIPVLDTLEAQALLALDATGLEREVIETWQDTLKLAARRLEAAWLALERVVDEELADGRRKADAVAQWRKPLGPVLAVGVVVLAPVLWLGLVLGGYVPAPEWLSQIWTAVFG